MPFLEQLLNLDFTKFRISNQENLAVGWYQSVYVSQ
jgi:hypothetical protein